MRSNAPRRAEGDGAMNDRSAAGCSGKGDGAAGVATSGAATASATAGSAADAG